MTEAHEKNLRAAMRTVARQQPRVLTSIENIPLRIPMGRITPVLDGSWYESFHSDFPVGKSGALIRLARRLNGYTLKGLPKEDDRTSERRKIEDAIETVHQSYAGLTNKSEHAADAHLYLTLTLVSAWWADMTTRMAAAFHDIVEDTEERPERVKFRPVVNGAPYPLEISSRDNILEFVGGGYGEALLPSVLRKLSRLPKAKDRSWKPAPERLAKLAVEYWDYLLPVLDDVRAATVKAADGIGNSWTIDTIKSERVRQKNAMQGIIKTGLQAWTWQKAAWVVAEMMLAEIEKREKGSLLEGTAALLRMIPRSEIGRFRAGSSWTGVERKFGPEAFLLTGYSGSPVVNFFVRNDGRIEGEFPLIYEAWKVIDMIGEVMGGKASDIRLERTVLPYNLSYATIASWESKERDVRGAERDIVEWYGHLVGAEHLVVGSDGNAVRFDRREIADAAEEAQRGWRIKDPPKILLPQNAAVREILGYRANRWARTHPLLEQLAGS